VRWFLFLVALGGGYGIVHALGAPTGLAVAAGWAAGILVLVASRRRGYAAAVKVERHRAAAAMLRQQDPDTYWKIVAQADGSEAEAPARRDPDAYVALFMDSAQRMGVSIDSSYR
jgi:hypothetical protein